MKRLLLDTQALLWWDIRDVRLGEGARGSIENATDVFVSAASAWEIAIKQALGKLTPPRHAAEAVAESGFSPLPVTFEHAAAVRDLPLHHRDPFDRLIIAAARVEGLTIVTSDPRFNAYDVPLLDARR